MTQRVLLTGPVRSFEQWTDELAGTSWDVETLALVETVPIDGVRFDDLGSVDWIVFTSQAAIEAVGLSGGLAHIPCAVVGRATAEVARAHGYDVRIVATGDSSASLALEMRGHSDGKHVLWCRGDLARDLGAALTAAGARVTARIVYRTRTRALTLTPTADVIFFASPSAVAVWNERWGQPVAAIAIGSTTGDAMRIVGWQSVRVLDEPTAKALSLELRRS